MLLNPKKRLTTLLQNILSTSKKYTVAVFAVYTLFLSLTVFAGTAPVLQHGQLTIEQGKIINQHRQIVSFAGPSFFWSNNGYEGEKFYNATTVKTFVDNWDATIIRAAMAAQGDGSYLTNPEDNIKKVEALVDAAIENNIYVIIDWHSHQAENNTEQAIEFFTYMAKKYGHTPNVIYEIYNEPLKDTDWDTIIKPYSEKLIAAIRRIDADNIIIVGTQTWSQDVDKAANNPIQNAINIAYSLHFYAGTHKKSLRKKAEKALQAGLTLFVSEWGTVNADGDGRIDKHSSEQWLAFLWQHQISHCSWSVTNKKENSAMLKPETTSLGPWQDHELSENGIYLKAMMKKWNQPAEVNN